MSKGSGPKTSRPGGLQVRRLLVSLFVGGAFTIIGFLLNWWLGTVLLLLTLYFICHALPASWAPWAYSVYAAFAIFWLTGRVLDGLVQALERGNNAIRLVVPDLLGFVLSIGLPILFWWLVVHASATWVLAISDSLGISAREARQFVRSQVFGTSRSYMTVENGEIVSQKPPGILSRLGGPGVLVVKPGNAVVLERGAKTARIIGPGVHRLGRFETIKKPYGSKGIVDLRPQEDEATPEVLTQDGIPVKMTVGQRWQIEPKDETDRRRSSQPVSGGATTPVLGTPEYPVYEESVRKAVFATAPDGWASMVPEAALNVLRDIVATYTLDQIFALDSSSGTRPDWRTVRRIELDVSQHYDPSAFGVTYLGMDIRHIEVPEDVRAQMVQRWKASQEWELRVQDAIAERKALIELSEGRAQALGKLEKAKLSARVNMANLVDRILNRLATVPGSPGATNFARLVSELAERIGEDEQVAIRYIEAMQAVIESPGAKSVVINPPYSGAGASAPPPPQSGGGGGASAPRPPQRGGDGGTLAPLPPQGGDEEGSTGG